MIRILCITMICTVQNVLAQRSFDVALDKKSLEEVYEISTLRFYLSNIRFHTVSGSWISEENSIHLIDTEVTSSWKIPLPEELLITSIDSVSFMLGIDSATNVSGILEGDLDPIKGMYWAWNSGYINFKVEGKRSGTKSGFEYHLGGYLPPFSTAREMTLGRNPKNKKMILRLQLREFLDALDTNELTEVMIPGADAVRLSDQLSNYFSLD